MTIEVQPLTRRRLIAHRMNGMSKNFLKTKASVSTRLELFPSAGSYIFLFDRELTRTKKTVN